MDPELPIAIFDSGVGGLTVFQAISRLLPRENIIYLADNKRVPYGGLSSETIVRYTCEAVSFLQAKQAKLIVLGCHTASVSCLNDASFRLFQQNLSIPVVGMTQGLKQMSNIRRLAVLGTLSTIRSGVYEKILRSQNPGLEVVSIACPLLVPRIEAGLLAHPETEVLVRSYLQPLQIKPVDAAFLACTHYPLIRSTFQKVLGENIALLDAAGPTAEAVRDYLQEKNLLNPLAKPKYTFYATEAPDLFAKRACHFLGENGVTPLINLCQI